MSHDRTADGYALAVERVIAAPADTVFAAFVDLYDGDRPDWVTAARLDLRPGGRWTITFRVPGVPEFTEERRITVLDPPRRLGYTATSTYDDGTVLETVVDLTLDAVPGGQRVRLGQRGFPTAPIRDTYAGAWPDVLAELARRVGG